VVYHLDPWRIPSVYAIDHEAREQEKNIAYVIATRAKEELYLIDMERIEV
jgi:superfamily I DNA/RNA helicase